ncbi:uncharacterized protein K02A2.6-like [Saccostrea cucullata]|uniref:uncharacterized protein K02A2.6-like n=1 Tax=Saccostrea cuccullata TaxID=36930 RepID=UPI002ED64EB1
MALTLYATVRDDTKKLIILSDPETKQPSTGKSRYSQTEREALAIVWACEHFDIYIRGANNVNIITDHKPLEKIWQKPRPPLRIERWGLRLQPYKLTIKYEPGCNNPADYMPHRKNSAARKESAMFNSHTISAECYVTKDASERDRTIQKAIEYTRNGRWYEMKNLDDHPIDIEELQAYRSIQDELVHCDTVLLRDKRLIMPKSLRDQAIKIAHEGHQGLAKTKAFLRSKVWFPGINDRVDDLIKDCLACQAITQSRQMEPLKMSELPQEPWSALSADFCGPLPSGDYLFVIIDEYSRYPVVEITKSVSAHSVIPILDKVLSTFGIPKVIKTDNGSPFNSHQFREYANNTGFTHRKITPRWPRANAQAEAFNKPLMKIKAAEIERRNWKQSMFQFLRQYRTTPHSSTGISPFKLLFNRETKTKLPSIPRKQTRNDELLRQNDEISKTMMKADADTERNVTRNTSFFKKTRHRPQTTEAADEEEIIDAPVQRNHSTNPEVEDDDPQTPRPTRR